MVIIALNKTVRGKIVKEFKNGYVSVQWKGMIFGAYRPQIKESLASDKFAEMVENTVFADINL